MIVLLQTLCDVFLRMINNLHLCSIIMIYEVKKLNPVLKLCLIFFYSVLYIFKRKVTAMYVYKWFHLKRCIELVRVVGRCCYRRSHVDTNSGKYSLFIVIKYFIKLCKKWIKTSEINFIFCYIYGCSILVLLFRNITLHFIK